MTVSINTLGANSRELVISGELSTAGIIAAVNTSLTALGWTLYDTVTTGAMNLLVTKVYSAPAYDNSTTKYMIIRYDGPRQRMSISCAEGWDTFGNAPINEAHVPRSVIYLPIQYDNYKIYIWASARYACFMGMIRTDPGPWMGVFEFERAAPEDVSAKTLPNFGWTSSITLGTPYCHATGGYGVAVFGPVAAGFFVPRDASGNTGAGCWNTLTVSTNQGAFPPPASALGGACYAAGPRSYGRPSRGMLADFSTTNSLYSLDIAKVPISNIKLQGFKTSHFTGKVFGLKVVAPIGSALDTTSIPVDSDGFYSSAGTPASHHVLNLHGGLPEEMTEYYTTTKETYTVAAMLGTACQQLFQWNGRFLYILRATGVSMLDLVTSTETVIETASSNWLLGVYDGAYYLYCTHTTGVKRLDLRTNTVTTLALTGISANAIDIDENGIWLADVTAGTTCKVCKVDIASFTQGSTFTGPTVTSNYNIAFGFSTGEYAGYIADVRGAISPVTITSYKIIKWSTADGTNTNVTGAGTGLSSGTPTGRRVHFFDPLEQKMYVCMANASGTASVNNTGTYVFSFSSATPSTGACYPGTLSTASIAQWAGYTGNYNWPCTPVAMLGHLVHASTSITTAAKWSPMPISTDRNQTGPFPANPGNTPVGAGVGVTFMHSTGIDVFVVTNTTTLTRVSNLYKNRDFYDNLTANIVIKA